MGIELLKQEMAVLETEYSKFAKGNKSAGVRARKSLQNIKRMAQELRAEISKAKSPDQAEQTPAAPQEAPAPSSETLPPQ